VEEGGEGEEGGGEEGVAFEGWRVSSSSSASLAVALSFRNPKLVANPLPVVPFQPTRSDSLRKLSTLLSSSKAVSSPSRSRSTSGSRRTLARRRRLVREGSMALRVRRGRGRGSRCKRVPHSQHDYVLQELVMRMHENKQRMIMHRIKMGVS
jgi:hypothetical protein